MLNQLFEFFQQALFLQRDVSKLKEDVASLQRELEETRALVNRLAFDLQRVNEREQQEREKLVLRLENALLRYERALPPSKGSKKEK